MFTFAEVMAMVAEAKVEEKKTKVVPHYYKRNGVMKKRSYGDTVYTERYKELFFDNEAKTLRSEAAMSAVRWLVTGIWKLGVASFQKITVITSVIAVMRMEWEMTYEGGNALIFLKKIEIVSDCRCPELFMTVFHMKFFL